MHKYTITVHCLVFVSSSCDRVWFTEKSIFEQANNYECVRVVFPCGSKDIVCWFCFKFIFLFCILLFN